MMTRERSVIGQLLFAAAAFFVVPLLLLHSAAALLPCAAAAATVDPPSCPGLDSWFPECWDAAHARISIGGDRTLYWTPFTSDRWGNALSGYWAARGLALLAGYGFDSYVGFQGHSWLSHLPKKVDPTTCPDAVGFAAACSACGPEGWEHPHRCGAAWWRARGVVRDDTHAAIEAWAAEVGEALPDFGAGDVVIQTRCAEDTMLSHPEYGPTGFSFFTANIDPSVTKKITIVADNHARHGLCLRLHKARIRALTSAFPSAVVETAPGSARGLDFARLLRAPVLFRDGQSSFGLWAAVANRGQVYSVPLLHRYSNDTQPDLGPDWHWIDAPVLYPRVAKAEGITLQDPAGIVRWLEAH